MSDDLEPNKTDDAWGVVDEYMERAAAACEAGDAACGMHLYLAAFGCASAQSRVTNETAILALKRAWAIACSLKERALAEYIFEKMAPYLSSVEERHCAKTLQALALDKLAEFGLTRERLAQVAGMAAGGQIAAGPMKLMHLGSFRVPEAEGGLLSEDDFAALERDINGEVAEDAEAETAGVPEAEASEAAGTSETVTEETDAVLAVVDLAEAMGAYEEAASEPADALEDAAAADPASAEHAPADPAPSSASDSPAAPFASVTTLDDLMSLVSGGAVSPNPAPEAADAPAGEMDPVDAYFSEQSLQDQFEEEFAGIRGNVHAEGGSADGGASAVAAPDLSNIPGSEVFNAPGVFEITEEGISLGPGFGLRLPKQEVDEEASRFTQMIDSLNETMSNFEKNNGERVTTPLPGIVPGQSQRMQPEAVAPGALPDDATYADLVGFDRAISVMQSFGIGMRDDPEFLSLVEALNELHGIDSIPATDSILFRSLAREDASQFMEATANELGLPMIRMTMDENIQGALMLCLTVRADSQPAMNRQRMEFEGPAVLCLEDIDLWMAPEDYESGDADVPWAQRLTPGAQEAVRLIRAAVENPEVYVLATVSTYGEVDSFFCDLITPFSVVEIDTPDEGEREKIWRALMRSHPSLGNLRLRSLIEYSANMPRADIYLAVREAIEEAYKQSLAMRTYLPVTYDNLLEKLSAYQPLESEEYKSLEDEVAGRLRSELDAFDSVDSLLGLDEGDGDGEGDGGGEGPLFSSDEDFGLDNPYFAL